MTTPKPTRQSNSESELRHIAARGRDNLDRARGAGLSSLTSFRDLGNDLIEAEELLPRGKYGRWVKAEFGINKSWSSRLKLLARRWAEVEAVIAEAKASGSALDPKFYSVDGMFRLLATRSRPAEEETAKASHGKQKANPSDKEPEAPDSEPSEIDRLRARVLELEAKLQARDSVGRTIKGRAQKTAELWVRGATEGERQAAEHRLRFMADKLDIGFPSFLRACGIEGPVDYTANKAA